LLVAKDLSMSFVKLTLKVCHENNELAENARIRFE